MMSGLQYARRVRRSYLTIPSCIVRSLRFLLCWLLNSLYAGSDEAMWTCNMQDMYGDACEAGEAMYSLRREAR